MILTMENQVITMLHRLSPEYQAEVIDFMEFLWLKKMKVSSMLTENTSLPPLPTLPGRIPSGWKDAIYDEL